LKGATTKGESDLLLVILSYGWIAGIGRGEQDAQNIKDNKPIGGNGLVDQVEQRGRR